MKTNLPPSFPQRGFTAIELLVVVAIIAILAALLWPTLSRASRAARTARCQSNVRQFHLGLALYVADHQVYPLHGPADAEGKDYLKWHWAIQRYTVATWMQDLYRCPDYRGLTVEGGAGSCESLGSYGYNIHGAEAGRRASLGLGGGGPDWPPLAPNVESSLRSPEDMIALGDASLKLMNSPHDEGRPLCAGNGSLSPPNGWGAVSDSYRLAPTRQRHGARLNISFADGHIEAIEARQFDESTESILRRWNSDHQPHQDLVLRWRLRLSYP